VEPQYEDDDSADAQEVAEQIALDEPHDQPGWLYLCFPYDFPLM